MKEINKYQYNILILASKLEKVIKVIKHSDPTAQTKKNLLYNKYKQNLNYLAEEFKQLYLWEDVKEFLEKTLLNSSSKIDSDNLKLIKNKLINDFESEFIEKPVLEELAPPDPALLNKKILKRKKKKAIVEKKEIFVEKYDKEKIMDMVKSTQKKRQGKLQLQSIINAIKKIDPEIIESKITNLMNSK